MYEWLQTSSQGTAAWLFSPIAILGWCLLVFIPCRILLGGADYLPSKAWQALCCIIPGFVVAGFLVGAFCVPLACDWATLFHVCLTLLYFQLDLGLGRILTGPCYGEICVPWMVLKELSPCPTDNSTTLSAKIKSKIPTPAFAKAPLFDFMIDLVSVGAHETFWNVFVCQNCLNHGMSPVLSILAVPVVSCIVHGLVSSMNVGLRMFPQFLHVALAYHISGSVLPPALIHHFWYLLDQKPLAVVKQAKRDWDIQERLEEQCLSPWDHYSTASMALILLFYLPLEAFIWRYPILYSSTGEYAVTLAGCGDLWSLPHKPIIWVLIVLFLLRIAMLVKQWPMKRIAYDAFLQCYADGSEAGQNRVAEAVLEFHEQKKLGTSLEDISSND